MIVLEHVALAPYTTFNIGGVARYFVQASSIEEVVEALAFARTHMLPIFILGGGSNVLISDAGFDGLVIALALEGITETGVGGQMLVTVGAGVTWDDFVLWSIEHQFHGLECMSGVPGTVGGAVVQNVGAYGAQVSDTFVSAEVIDTEGARDKVQVMRRDVCDFSYHDSIFGKNSGRFVVVRATFALSREVGTTPAYRDNRFDMAKLKATLGHEPTQTEVRAAVLTMREEKGSLIMAGRVSYRSAGSFFHMPFVSKEEYADVVKRTQELDADKEERLRPWAWEQKDGSYKLAPGFLLEYTEFKKGYVKGGVGVSPRHTLSIINVHEGLAREVADLARAMQAVVKKIFNVDIEREVEYVGDVETK